MRYLIFITALLILSSLTKAQNLDTIDAKVKKLPNLNFEIPPRIKKQSIYTYLDSTIQYPKNSTTNIKGQIIIKMFIDTNGIISNIKLLKKLNWDVDDEVIHVISTTPKMKPAIMDGKNVDLNLVLNIVIDADSVSQTIQTDVYKYHFESRSEADTEKISNGKNTINVFVEQVPSYPGGWQALSEYLSQNLNYPTAAKTDSIQGKVIVAFIVEKNGSLSNFEVLQSPDDSLSIEALRVIKTIRYFIPGIQNGRPVSVRFKMPITFSLSK